MSSRVKVLVVDDSALMRKLIPQIIEKDGSIQVVGTAIDGNFALKKIEELAPQVITLDLEMPGLNGIDTLKAVMRKHQIPVIVVSSHTTSGASVTLKALALGAFDFVAKPQDVSAHMPDIADELIGKIKAAALSKGVRVQPIGEGLNKIAKPAAGPDHQATRVTAIGISTGGPHALQYMLSQLPSDFPGTIVIAQHMPEGFTEMFARRLDECCSIRVKEAASGDLLVAGRALICPGNRHVKVKRLPLGEVALLSDEARVNGHRPSVDVLFRSLADEFGPRGIAVLMTGMGDDGANGLAAVQARGGLTIAQSEDSCVVFGMPKAAIERGFATRVVHLDVLAKTLHAQCSTERRRTNSAGAAEPAKSAGAGRN